MICVVSEPPSLLQRKVAQAKFDLLEAPSLDWKSLSACVWLRWHRSIVRMLPVFHLTTMIDSSTVRKPLGEVPGPLRCTKHWP